VNPTDAPLLVLLDPADAEHRATDGGRPVPHAERPERTRAVEAALRRSAFADRLAFAGAPAAERAQLEAVHPGAFLDALERHCARGGGWIDPDTFATTASFEVARRAAGAAVLATRAVLDGRASAAFAACRPPGHHAESDRAMGFCLVNGVAAAAQDAIASGRAERVFVFDFDVHHGNGTQAIFEARADVFYASLHQGACFPGTGAADERGRGAGIGATLNRPLAPGSNDADWLAAFEREVAPALAAFAPDLLLFSAGFDGHAADPLAACELDAHTYFELTRRALEVARPSTGGRVASVLEGGYDLDALGECACAHAEALLG